jgi:serine/threonine protein kinase
MTARSKTELEEVAQRFCRDRSYAFLRRVGSGAFKETFHVLDAAGLPFALKVFRPGASPERSEREVQALRRCSHEGVARLTAVDGFNPGDGAYLIVLEEFLPAGTLTELLARSGLLPPDKVKSLAIKLVNAVTHIASLGLVHRDLKPDNVLFRDSGAPVIVDFGLVRDLNAKSLTQTWQLHGPGTPLFAPPEQLLNDKHLIDWRSDQFSLAVTLSFATFGFHPYEEEGATMRDVVERVAQRVTPTSRFVRAANDAGLNPLNRMAQPWPVQRFRSADLLAAAWEERRA